MSETKPKKTPKYILDMLAHYQVFVGQVERAIHAKNIIPVHNQPDEIKHGSEELWVARVAGMQSMIKFCMSKAGCFGGAVYVSDLPSGLDYKDPATYVKRPIAKYGDEDYKFWRVDYKIFS